MTRGRIVLVPFPFDDLASSKVRPALCLTDPIGPHRHVVLAFITSVVPEQLEETDLVVDPESEEGAGSGLKVRSALRLHRIVTLSTSVIRRNLGTLSPDLEGRVASMLAALFSLPRAAEAPEEAEAPTSSRQEGASAEPSDGTRALPDP